MIRGTTPLEIGNIADHLTLQAQERPYSLAIAAPAGRDSSGRTRHVHYTYRQLEDDSNRIAAGLLQLGIGPGVRTALMVTPGLDLFAVVFALLKSGAIPVLVDPGLGRKGIGSCLADAAPEAFIGIPKAHLARRLFGWGRQTVRTAITVGGKGWGATTLQEVRRRGSQAARPGTSTRPEDVAAILFTSGSTGAPKGVVYTHQTFLGQVERIRTTYDIRPGEIDLPTFPLFALFDPALGMAAVIPEMNPTRPADVDPRRIIQAIEDFGVTNMFGSPALINAVGRYGEKHGTKLPTLRRVLSAGAPVPAAVLERFAGMLNEDTQVFTPYGATEALPVASIGSDEVLTETRQQTESGNGVCVGLPVAGVDVDVIPIHDRAIDRWDDAGTLPRGEIGEIVVRGDHVTREYFRRPAETALAKIVDPSAPVRHRMGDVGYLDDRGRLWFCGRKSHRVLLDDGTTLHTIPCEGVFNVHPAVYRTALVGVTEAGRTLPVLCVELEAGAAIDPATLRRELAALGKAHDHTRIIERFLIHPAFPVDIRHNAKIFREKLAVWAAAQTAPAAS
ncbi:MAG: fatty acid CoA ligase family protein [Planctomycetota bacterium]